MTIVPQDPHLFNDTLRNNLDPNSHYKDAELIKILKDFEIWEKFKDDKGLIFKVESGGTNLSQGEKQLLVLCRALLNKNKIVLFDEATANIDVRTESLIQKAIETQFSGSTMIMIAHRLETIKFCDKVLSLEKGKVIEFGSTTKLQDDPDSYFGGLLKTADNIKENLS